MLVFRGAITAAEDRNHDDREGHSPVEAECLKYLGRIPAGLHPTITVTPVVNHGRWVVPCPWCFSASMASRTDRRFFCVECRNVGANGEWVSVVWPESESEIEATLVMRPDPRSRVWLAHETLADLLEQNEHLGVI